MSLTTTFVMHRGNKLVTLWLLVSLFAIWSPCCSIKSTTTVQCSTRGCFSQETKPQKFCTLHSILVKVKWRIAFLWSNRSWDEDDSQSAVAVSSSALWLPSAIPVNGPLITGVCTQTHKFRYAQTRTHTQTNVCMNAFTDRDWNKCIHAPANSFVHRSTLLLQQMHDSISAELEPYRITICIIFSINTRE